MDVDPDVKDLKDFVILLGGITGGLVILSIIFGIISTVYAYRTWKKFNLLSLTIKTTRLDVATILEKVEKLAVVRNPIVEDDGTEEASPIFTRKMYTPTPPIQYSVPVIEEQLSQRERIRHNLEYGRHNNNNNNNNEAGSTSGSYGRSGDRRPRQGPPVPPRRAASFYETSYNY